MVKKFLLFFGVLLLVVVAGCVGSSGKNDNSLSENVGTAWNLYKEGRYQSALVYCDKAISENPNDKWAWFVKGKVHYQLNESSKAVECFNKSIHIDPNFADAYFWMGLTYKSYYTTNDPSHHTIKSDYKTAREYIGKAIELNPNNDIYYSYMAQCYIFDDLSKSIKYIDKAISLNPDNAGYWVQKANYLQLNNDYNNALQCYDEALKIEPNNVDIMLKKAELYHSMGLDSKEQDVLKQVEKINPKKAEYYRLIHNYQ